jgi:integrase/recombinase XerD
VGQRVSVGSSTCAQWKAAKSGSSTRHSSTTCSRYPDCAAPPDGLGRDIDDTEIDALFNTCDPDTVVGRRDRALLALLVYGGLRRSECAAVDVAMSTSLNRVVTVRAGKGRKNRQIPIPRVAADILGDWLEVHPTAGNCCVRWTGGATVAAGSAQTRSHSCSSGCVTGPGWSVPARTRFVRDASPRSSPTRNSDVFLAAKMAGHSSIAVTARYDRRGLDALTGVIDDLDGSSGSRLRVVA